MAMHAEAGGIVARITRHGIGEDSGAATLEIDGIADPAGQSSRTDIEDIGLPSPQHHAGTTAGFQPGSEREGTGTIDRQLAAGKGADAVATAGGIGTDVKPPLAESGGA